MANEVVDGAGLETRTASRLELSADALRWTCDPASLPFQTTEEVEPLSGSLGQGRAIESLAFGLEMEVAGFNVFVSGQPGTGRSSIVRSQLSQIAATRPVPNDWCYVHNFKDATRPLAIGLPPGRGATFARDMAQLIDEARRELSRAFESKQFRQQQEQTHRAVEQSRDQLMQELSKRAEAGGFGISLTPAGPAIFPILNGRPMTEQQLSLLPDDARQRLLEQGEELSRALREVVEQVRQMEKETHERMAELHRSVAEATVGPLISALQAGYADQPLVVSYLAQLQDDLVTHDLELWREVSDDEEQPNQQPAMSRPAMPLDRYRVNLLVDNAELGGAPVVFESNPTYYNLLGRVEYEARMGAMTTSFNMIRAGALHRANGGYLVLNAQDVVTSPFAWAMLKRALRDRQIQIENMGDQFSPVPAATLRPAPIPLAVKVVLIGPPQMYYLLRFYDEEFAKLFRVRADFDTEFARDTESLAGYAAFISNQVRQLGLRHFDRTGVARVAEYAARLAEDQRKLSAAFNDVVDLVAEASYWAQKAGAQHVTAAHVDTAIQRKVHRSNLYEEKLRELVGDGTILIDTQGTRVGQINGLSILSLGDYSFGRPVRITAQTALGADGVVNIERETQMSGRVHSKGFLILTSLLLGRYGQDKPVALAARLTFEQTYDEVDGDSASCGELCCLLSSLAGIPLRQDVAITGSINQLGEVQAIGGATHKIEGFFDVCSLKGLTGRQGVILPAANIHNLMLRTDVVDAVRDGRFHLWAVHTVDEALEILTGRPAGVRRPDGTWEPGSVNALVDAHLLAYAERRKDFGRNGAEHEIRERTPAQTGPRTPRVRRR